MEQKTNTKISRLEELAYEIRVGQAMATEVITVSPNTTIGEFKELLRVNRISGTPVVDGRQMVGIISIEDLVKALDGGCELDVPVKDKMTTDLVTVYADEPLAHAISEFTKFGFGRFPVINRSKELVGIITTGDIARVMLEQLEVSFHQEEVHRYRASHIFNDIVADDVALVFGYRIAGKDFDRAGEASSALKRTLTRLGISPQIIRRLVVATYEAEMNMVIFADSGEIVVEVRSDHITIETLDKGPGISNIEQAMQPGFSTAPVWVQNKGFGAGMGLPNIQSCSDEMELESTVGVGTHLKFLVYT